MKITANPWKGKFPMKTYRLICKLDDGGRCFVSFNVRNDRAARDHAKETFDANPKFVNITVMNDRRKVYGITRVKV